MFHHILVPMDGSELSERSIPHAIEFARIFGSKISLLRVLEVNSPQENPALIDPLNWQIRKAEAETYLRDVAGRIHDRLAMQSGGTESAQLEKERVAFTVREGRIAENILNFAHSENVDLLIISTHGMGGLNRWNVSSVTEKVVRMIYLPVLIVQAYMPSAVEDPQLFYRRILVPTDSSRRSESAIPAAIALANGVQHSMRVPEQAGRSPDDEEPAFPEQHTRLIFASVIKTPEVPIPEPYPQEVKELQRQFNQISRRAIQDYLNMMKDRVNVPCETCLVESKHIPSAIHELAEKNDIDLVLMSAHGYTGQFTAPYGSVAFDYIEHGTRPVLIIQDVPRSQVKPTAAQVAAEKAGER